MILTPAPFRFTALGVSQNRKADAALAPNQNIENNPMESSRGRLAGCFSP